eukprot:980564-Pelagomonas_calceolata.AAC.2
MHRQLCCPEGRLKGWLKGRLKGCTDRKAERMHRPAERLKGWLKGCTDSCAVLICQRGTTQCEKALRGEAGSEQQLRGKVWLSKGLRTMNEWHVSEEWLRMRKHR